MAASAAHGHGLGAFISTRLGFAHADKLLGIHITLLAVPREPVVTDAPTPAEARFNEQLRHWRAEEAGYSQIMGTKPQTLAYALTDSPAGLAAWDRPRSSAAGATAVRRRRPFRPGRAAEQCMLYWATGAINSDLLALLRAPPRAVDRAGREGPDGPCRVSEGNSRTAALGRRTPVRQPPPLDRDAARRAFSGAGRPGRAGP
ncbi:MAG: hypothetical protein WDN24_07895 [Sphingomonas sp.]